jgi:hypothetical protein
LADNLHPIDLAVPPFFCGLKSENVKASKAQQQEISKILRRLAAGQLCAPFRSFSNDDDAHISRQNRSFHQKCINGESFKSTIETWRANITIKLALVIHKGKLYQKHLGVG